MKAYAEGSEYYCIPTDAQYYKYNEPAADERKAWKMEQVWEEYEMAHDELKRIVETIQALAGHAQASTTFEIYSHLLPGYNREAADKIEGMFKVTE